jgi:hypothetical protein
MLVFVCMLLLGTINTSTYAYEVNGINYERYDDGGSYMRLWPVEVISPDSAKYSGKIIIPDTVYIEFERHIVKHINKEAFHDCPNLIKVRIPKNIVYIEPSTFKNCDRLDTVLFDAINCKWPNFDPWRPESFFTNCNSLRTIIINDSVNTIPYKLFSYCSGLKRIVVGKNNKSYSTVNSVLFNKDSTSLLAYPNAKSDKYTIPMRTTFIENYAFEGCDSLKEITISDSVRRIGSSFTNCKSLKIINFNAKNCVASQHNIIYPIFYQCDSLDSIKFGRNVTKIYSDLFYGCNKLKNIYFPDSLRNIGKNAFYGCSGLGRISIPENVTSIDALAFENCTSLKRIDYLAKDCSTIINAFKGCDSVNSVLIGPEVNTIPNNAFGECIGLKTIYFNAKACKSCDFNGNKLLQSVFFGDSVKSIPNNIFRNCSNITNLILGNNIQSIGDSSFISCTGLSMPLIIPQTLNHIGYNAFKGCTNLVSVKIDNLAKWSTCNFDNETANPLFYAHKLVYKDSLITELNISDFEKIGNYSFENCTNIKKISIAKLNSNIGQSAFKNCINLASISFNDSVGTVGNSAFENCTNLKSISFTPSSIKAIGNSTFKNCLNIDSISLPNSIEKICDSAFEGCSKIKRVNFPDSNLTTIGNAAFKDCISMDSLSLNNSINSLGNSAFENCSNIKNISFTNSLLKSIGIATFKNCTSLDSLSISNSVESIGDSAFYDCNGLTKVLVGKSVIKMGKSVFKGCRYITAVYSLNSKAPNADETLFEERVYYVAPLCIPQGSTSSYKNMPGWKDFLNIKEALNPGGINDVQSNIVNVKVIGHNLIINAADNDIISIYKLNGQLISSNKDKTVNGLDPGLYIVKIGEKSYKVLIK